MTLVVRAYLEICSLAFATSSSFINSSDFHQHSGEKKRNGGERRGANTQHAAYERLKNMFRTNTAMDGWLANLDVYVDADFYDRGGNF